MKKIMEILFLSCLKASALIEKKLHIKLSFTERVQLKAHKMMCEYCTAYEKQTILLEKGIEQHLHQNEKTVDLEELKKKINLNLKESKK